MNDMNCVNLTGRLTRDPELKSGSVCKFSIAVDGSYKKDGEKIEKTHFVECVMFGGGGEWFAGNVQKGDRVGLTGELSFNSWQTPEGEKRSRLEVKADKFILLGKPAGR